MLEVAGKCPTSCKMEGDCPRETIMGKCPGKCLDPARLYITQSSTMILVIISVHTGQIDAAFVVEQLEQ